MKALLRPVLRDREESPIRALSALMGEPGMISLAGGHPDPGLLPRDWFVESARRVLDKLQSPDLQYGASDGLLSLRESLCELLRERLISARPSDVLITTGSQQSISLLIGALLGPGDTMAMAPFNYPAVIQAVRFAGADIVTLDHDCGGLEAAARGSATGCLKAVYVVSSFANPTAHVMSLEARVRLLEAAVRSGVCVIEDDPYGELWFDEPPPHSLCALNQSRNIGATVAYATSFSKIIAPAFRLGALVAPPEIRKGVLLVKQATDVHSSTIDQRFLEELLRSGRLQQHLQALRAAYRRKAQAMVDALTKSAADLLSFVRPGGGMFVWAAMSDAAPGVERIDWFAFGRRHRVLVVPGSAFSPIAAPNRFVRLSFANPPLEEIGEGVRRFAAGLAAELAMPAAKRVMQPAPSASVTP